MTNDYWDQEEKIEAQYLKKGDILRLNGMGGPFTAIIDKVVHFSKGKIGIVMHDDLVGREIRDVVDPHMPVRRQIA